MYQVEYYEDQRGRRPVEETLDRLRERAQSSKDARIQFEKILAHVRALEEFGTRIGEPKVKYLGGDLWELRPLSHRILFFYWRENKFILLHHFIKKSQKTPVKEIERAARNLRDHVERHGR